MAKLIVFALLACLACRVLTQRWPWELWAISERSQAEAQARALLGVDRAARREAIIEAHRRLIARVHPDRGGSNDAVHAANAARDLLLARLERNESE
ncbi:molecular chaperone DnaJ [Novosphingobium ginsenosidimutans]|uniref:Molecular chaperone DnaJ n=1 Tax=Novosphingobium ginsenosidimutans TaxID=1176536 RepID=A0A5B8S3L5_9SPHN|nr:molecular chaperone DnaJ [Novosphingobium ginsenosidimutans]QEA15883.1 molecular chaperone DnaJ [Novosphingobium ginsenosidimutans]